LKAFVQSLESLDENEVEVDHQDIEFDEWKHCLKLGPEWELEEDNPPVVPARKRAAKKMSNVEPSELFWQICINQGPKSFEEELQNLSFVDSPDIFLDSECESDCSDDPHPFYSSTSENIQDHPKWDKSVDSGCDWQVYYDDYIVPERDAEGSWTHKNLERVVESLESFDCAQTSFIKHLDVSEDVEDILERNLSIFEDNSAEAEWNEIHKFGFDWSKIILESAEGHWNNSHLFGSLWTNSVDEVEEHCRLQWKKQTKVKVKRINLDIMEYFWNLTFKNSKPISHEKTLKFLPSWEGPDILADSDNLNAASDGESLDLMSKDKDDEELTYDISFLFENSTKNVMAKPYFSTFQKLRNSFKMTRSSKKQRGSKISLKQFFRRYLNV